MADPLDAAALIAMAQQTIDCRGVVPPSYAETLAHAVLALQEELASYKPSPEDIAEAQENMEREEAGRDRAERAMWDDAYNQGYSDASDDRRETP